MSQSSAQDKTERASPKRKRDARERGQVPRSRDLTTALVMVTGAGLLIGAGAGIVDGAMGLMRHSFQFAPEVLLDPGLMPLMLGQTLVEAFRLVAPVILGLMAIALVAPMLLGGWNFSTEALMPDLSRLNPLAGLSRMFSLQGLMELLKNFLKFLLVAGVAGVVWWGARGELLGLSAEPGRQGLAHAGQLILHAFGFLCGILLLIAALDVPYQIWQYEKQLRMTKQELKEEFKESEGRPEVKSRIRGLQQQMSRRRMMDKVPSADVIVMNPTHYAVALQYKQGKMRAPVVVAKGVDQIALAIRALGQQHKVPVLEAPPLARALYRNTELDAEIPVNLYAAVAQVLTYVYQLKMYRSGPPPRQPALDDVPGGEPDSR